jgi:PAS domain S-box-containing protein
MELCKHMFHPRITMPFSTDSHTDEVQRLVIDNLPTMVWTVRSDGVVDFVNRFWLDYTGISLEEELAEPTRPIYAEDLPRVMEKWRENMASKKSFEDEMRLRRADGEYRWFLIRTAPLFDERRNIVKWYGSGTEIEDGTRAEISSRRRLPSERNYIDEQIRTAFHFENIIGRSKALKEVLQQASIVAPTDSAVIIFGETGTGKELLARAIHDLSSRRNQPFIKLDCSAIPATLLESELFGHEKGAFTGAIEQRVGRFQIADKGTLFLDEVGNIPMELQPKLLRVLEDQAFERLGSNRTLHLDVRVIAATNRNLEDMIGKCQFHADLYYRLKVFPITIPPLRDRRDDIPLLVRHYMRKHAHRMGKTIDTIPEGAMEIFARYPWPGNIRELHHFIERSVVFTSGNVLQPRLRELEQVIRNRAADTRPFATRTMEEIERESILQALRESNWVVGGPLGAAAKLGLKRTTLASRIERLGISRVR